MSVSTVYDDVMAGVFEDEHAEEATQSAEAVQDTVSDEAASEDGDAGAAGDAGDADSNALSGEIREQALDDKDGRIEPGSRHTVGSEPAADRKRKRRREKRSMTREERLRALRRQVEYYLSDGNLIGDTFFHQKISQHPQGWLDATLVLGCNRVKKLEISDEADIEEALAESELETQWLSAADGKTLQLRRKNGRALPDLRAAGWLATQIEQRRQAGEAALTNAKPEPSKLLQTPKVGDKVQITAGESAGQSGQVLSVEDGEFTVLVGGVDVAVVSLSELEVEAPA